MSNKIGIFGGTFDPFHYGHLNSILSVADRFDLVKTHVVPTEISPLRVQTEGPGREHRLAMLEAGVSGHEDRIVVDKRELDRGGVSYTIDTVKSMLADMPDASPVLIIGMDQFIKLDQWREFDRLLGLVDLVVTSRPGMELPYSLDDWPLPVRAMVADFDGKQAILKNGRVISFVQLDDVEASGTEIRKKLRLGQTVHGLVPPGVDEYIREHKLYESVQRKIGDFEKFAAYCAAILKDKGGVNVQTYDLTDRSAPSEFTVIVSGTSTRHASALADHVIKEVKKDYGVWPENIEGQSEGRWVVVDYGALIIHSFYDFVRQEYKLENLWTKPVKPT